MSWNDWYKHTHVDLGVGHLLAVWQRAYDMEPVEPNYVK
jgi:hypothetical protein